MVKKRITGENVAGSSSFRRARDRASDYAEDPEKLNDLLDRATRKARDRRGPLAEVWDLLMSCLRLLRAYAAGRYRDIPWTSLVSIIAAVLYFVIPTDLIPDFLLGLGFIDDAALLAWIIASLRGDLDQFLEWEREQGALDDKSPEESAHE